MDCKRRTYAEWQANKEVTQAFYQPYKLGRLGYASDFATTWRHCHDNAWRSPDSQNPCWDEDQVLHTELMNKIEQGAWKGRIEDPEGYINKLLCDEERDAHSSRAWVMCCRNVEVQRTWSVAFVSDVAQNT